MFAHSVYVTIIAACNRVRVKHARDVAAPRDEAIFVANLISMIGSGMNAAAVTWYILQATHSEVSLGLLVALQTLPSLRAAALHRRAHRPRRPPPPDDVARRLPRAGHPAGRGAGAHPSACSVWQLYGMTMLVSIGFWMFWPTINALVQELTPEDKIARLQLADAGGRAGRLGTGGSDGRLCVQQDRTRRHPAGSTAPPMPSPSHACTRCARDA